MESPDRYTADAARSRLIALDDSQVRPAQRSPASLPRGAILELPELFQPRDMSLRFSPGQSEAHIRKLTTYVRRGAALDPVSVASFGAEWVLIDGHHRIEAYARAGWSGAIPVKPLESDRTGEARVAWAIRESVGANFKDKLAMSGADKSDAAWRMVMDGSGSKSEQAAATGVSVALIAKMRKTLRLLQGLGNRADELITMGWGRAQFEARNPTNDDRAALDYMEMRRRKLAKALTSAMRLKPSALDLIETLEGFRSGIAIELHTLLTTGDWEGGTLRQRDLSGLDI